MPIRAIAEWKPPPNPNPRMILDSARADARAGSYEDALAKHVWFHQHALEHDRSYFGVRLTGALMSWHELAKVYPPALKALKEIRDEAAKKVLESKGDVQGRFLDMSAINEELGDENHTVALFAQLDKKLPKAAKEVYEVAQPSLVKAKKFELCGKYLDPENSYSDMVARFKAELEYAQQFKSADEKQHRLQDAEHFLPIVLPH